MRYARLHVMICDKKDTAQRPYSVTAYSMERRSYDSIFFSVWQSVALEST